MPEIITVTATLGENGKYYYFKKVSDKKKDYESPNTRISKDEFETLSKLKSIYHQSYNSDKQLIGFKVEDDSLDTYYEAEDKRVNKLSNAFIIAFFLSLFFLIYLLFKWIFSLLGS